MKPSSFFDINMLYNLFLIIFLINFQVMVVFLVTYFPETGASFVFLGPVDFKKL